MVRYEDRVRACGDCDLGILRIEDTLHDELARPELAHPLQVASVERRIELLLDPFRQDAEIARVPDGVLQVSESIFLASQHAECPARMPGDIENIGKRQSRRNAETV